MSYVVSFLEDDNDGSTLVHNLESQQCNAHQFYQYVRKYDSIINNNIVVVIQGGIIAPKGCWRMRKFDWRQSHPTTLHYQVLS